jgi:predicted LPLAT superfamily acyltransferase
VILFFGIYRGGNRYDVYLESLGQTIRLAPDRWEEDVRRWTQRYADRLAEHSRQSPDNWFNFYDFWHTSN